MPVIIITAQGSEEDQLKGLTYGADHYITKPFRLRVLLAYIENLLNRYYSLGTNAHTSRLFTGQATA